MHLLVFPAPIAEVCSGQPPPLGTHPMQTRAKSGIFKPIHRSHVCIVPHSGLLESFLTMREPKGFKSAAKHSGWIAVMDEEFRPFTKIIHGIWYLNRPMQMLWALNGFSVSNIYRMAVSTALKPAWLQRAIHNNREEVYMDQPPGYVDSKHPSYVCHLRRALYGLKQAPRVWLHRVSTFLLAIGFVCSQADSSLFVLSKGADLIYLLLYVDDIVVTGNNTTVLDDFICRLTSEFSTKDLGSLNYFLGLEAHLTSAGLFLSQTKYALEILQRAHLVDSKPVCTPLVVAQHLSTMGLDFDDPHLFRSLVGALQYLTITRPDITHAVSVVSQFMHKPSISHFLAVKRILRYIKGTLRFGLSFTPSSSRELLAYLDADWAGYPDTRRLVSGYAIYFGEILVSWSSKKQPTVSRSSCESEYRALALTTSKVKWL
ncbi:uncharacterized protein LOC111391851 [Olea europaea var. sylvestris]|uniref:uncharacterized protein LOC111391851 n=1 Tax=Olea europaea var. sylvestris TaxID=158386 RepID=UPI000C1CFA76|nr:uncharacterized protein LOC111391851 [Olea europaea var. sylvestris]